MSIRCLLRMSLPFILCVILAIPASASGGTIGASSGEIAGVLLGAAAG